MDDGMTRCPKCKVNTDSLKKWKSYYCIRCGTKK